MRNIEEYTKDTDAHIPEGYDLLVSEVEQIHKISGDWNMIIFSWKMGFEMAYRAAKRGKLDFQK